MTLAKKLENKQLPSSIYSQLQVRVDCNLLTPSPIGFGGKTFLYFMELGQLVYAASSPTP
jgi:hypothetical protein